MGPCGGRADPRRRPAAISALLDGTPYDATKHEGGIISAPDRATYDLIRRELVG